MSRKTARVGRARAARKTEKAPTLRSRSLIRKEVNISEMLVRVVGSRTPRFTRQCVLPPDCTHIFKGVECGRICTSVKPLFRRLALLVSHTLIFKGEIVLLTFVIYFISDTNSTPSAVSYCSQFCHSFSMSERSFPSHLTYLLYHTLNDLSRVFSNFFKKFMRWGFEPPQAVYTATLADTISHNREALIN